MELSNRIKTIVAQIEYDTIADIGTDHGYIAVHAVASGKARKAIACDINGDCLKKAQSAVELFGLTDYIETRLGDGLAPVKPGEAAAVVIAGMGGLLTIDILKRGRGVSETINQLILSPHTHITEVRRFVHQAGFFIHSETMLKEDRIFYSIIDCRKGEEAKPYTNIEYLTSRALSQTKTEVFIEYTQTRIRKLESIRENIRRADEPNEQSIKRLNEINETIEMYKGALANECNS